MFLKVETYILLVTADLEVITFSNVHYIILSSSERIFETALVVWSLFLFVE